MKFYNIHDFTQHSSRSQTWPGWRLNDDTLHYKHERTIARVSAYGIGFVKAEPGVGGERRDVTPTRMFTNDQLIIWMWLDNKKGLS